MLNKSVITTLLIMLLGVNFLYGKNEKKNELQNTQNISKNLKENVKQTLKANDQTVRFVENQEQLSDSKILYNFKGSKGATNTEGNKIAFFANQKTLNTKPSNDEKEVIIKATYTFSLTMEITKQFPKINLGKSFVTSYNLFLSKNDGAATTN